MLVNDEIGNLLVEEGYITSRQLERAEAKAQEESRDIDKVLIQMGYVSEDDVTQVKGKKMGCRYVDLSTVSIDPELSSRIPENMASQYKVIPIAQEGKMLTLAMVDPLNVMAIDDIRLVTGFDIEPVIVSETAIEKAIGTHYGTTDLAEVDKISQELAATDWGAEGIEVIDDNEEELSEEDLAKMGDEAPIVKIVNLIIAQGINDGASDIHIEPEAKSLRVRYRVDGILHEVMTPPKHIQAPMTSRIKIMSNLDIAERRVPQDGKIHMTHDGREYDLRVSTLPTVHGEKTVMRILDKSSVRLGLDKLGFTHDNLTLWEDIVDKPYGMLLVTGPTGSGKSTTLYSCLNRLNVGDRNITTVEDPVEYQLEGINQTQTNNKAGLTFASALKSFLRQDPDIIMVGEIRDGATAKIAVEAALTGHLVLSTLHTNDSTGAISRLTEMDVEPFLVSSALIGVLAQRLTRRICPDCKESYRPTPEELRRFGLSVMPDEEILFYRGSGCDSCKMGGYRGRSGIHEVFTPTDRTRALILNHASNTELRQAAIEDGMRTMQDDGLAKTLQGLTTMEECMRVVFVG